MLDALNHPLGTSSRPRAYIYARATGRPTMLPDPHERPVVTAEEAFAELGIDRSTGYKAIREGTFPVPVIRVGRVIRVPTVALRRLLRLDAPRTSAVQEHAVREESA